MKVTRKYTVQNMLSQSCIRLVKLYYDSKEEIEVKKIVLGEVILVIDDEKTNDGEISEQLAELGFNVIHDSELQLVEQIKQAAIELIHHANNISSLIRNSDYISDKLQTNYEKLSKIFSNHTGLTLEKYIILLKIEKAKEMIINEEYTLSEISYLLGYSSVQYLSNQFKKTSGLTVSEFKQNPEGHRIPLEKIIGSS